jgi:hypothetical protein
MYSDFLALLTQAEACDCFFLIFLKKNWLFCYLIIFHCSLKEALIAFVS